MAGETVLDRFVTELKFRTDHRALGRLEARINKLRSRLNTISRGAAVAGTALTTAGAGALTAFASYEKGFAEMAAKTGKDFETLEAEYGPVVRKIARETGVSIDDIQRGFQKGISAGLEGEALIRAVTQATKAQAAGIGSLEDTISSATTAWSVLGVDADKAMDIITASAQLGEGETADFGQALKGLVGFGKTLGLEFDDLAAGIAAVSQAAKSVPVGETQLRGFLKALASPSEQAKKTLDELGLGITHEDLRKTARDKGLYAVFSDLQQMMEDLKAQGKDVAPIIAKLFPEVEAQQFVSTIEAIKIKELREEIEEAGPAIDKAFGQGSKTVHRQWTRLVQSFTGASITIGERLVPAFESIVGVMNALVTAFDEMPSLMKDIIAGFLSLGPILLGVSGIMVAVSKGLGLLVAGLKIARTAWIFMWAAATGPVGLIYAIIAAVIGAAWLIWENWETIVKWLSDLWQDFTNWLRDLLPERLGNWLFGERDQTAQEEARFTGTDRPAEPVIPKAPSYPEMQAKHFGIRPPPSGHDDGSRPPSYMDMEEEFYSARPYGRPQETPVLGDQPTLTPPQDGQPQDVELFVLPGVTAPLPVAPETPAAGSPPPNSPDGGPRTQNITMGDINITAVGADADSLHRDAQRQWERQVLVTFEQFDSQRAY